MLETYTYKCELTTEADAFMEWFHKTLSECVIAANAGTITRSDGWGTARGRVPVDLSLDGNEYAWTLENVYPPDWSAQRLDEMLTIERLHDSYSAPHIGYRAKRLPVTPARLEVDLYWAGAEIADVWDCLRAKLARLTATAPAGTVDQVGTVDSESQDADRPNVYAGTPEKVRETHKMRKAGKSWVWIRKYCRGCATYESYMKYCREHTGEEPLTQV